MYPIICCIRWCARCLGVGCAHHSDTDVGCTVRRGGVVSDCVMARSAAANQITTDPTRCTSHRHHCRRWWQLWWPRWERLTAINGDLRWWWLCESKGEPHYCGDSLISPTSPQWPNLLISITSISPTRKIFSPQNRIPQLSKLACSRWTAYCRWQNSFENIYQLKLEAGKSPEHFTL